MVITRFISIFIVNEFALGVRFVTIHSSKHSKSTIRKIFKGLIEKMIIVLNFLEIFVRFQ